MNWYKITKQATPLYETNVMPFSYTALGHSCEDDAALWLIDKNFSFFSIPVYSNNNDWQQELEGQNGEFDDDDLYEKRQHGNWKKYIDNQGSMIASGRYADEKLSLTFGYQYKKSPSFNSIKNRVLKILDKEFDNPIIYDYS